MLSYLSNRHYHSLTQLLPPELRWNQPQKIYYPTFMNDKTLKILEENKKITHRMLGTHSNKETVKKEKALKKERSGKSMNACPLCQETHIYVQYHGYQHICVKCRNFVRDEYGNQIKIFLNQSDGAIVCLGILPKSFDRDKVGYYITDHTKLEVDNIGVYATFAGEKELVLILKQKQNK